MKKQALDFVKTALSLVLFPFYMDVQQKKIYSEKNCSGFIQIFSEKIVLILFRFFKAKNPK